MREWPTEKLFARRIAKSGSTASGKRSTSGDVTSTPPRPRPRTVAPTSIAGGSLAELIAGEAHSPWWMPGGDRR